MCVLATQLANGSPHTASMHFVHQDNTLYFSTHFGNRKLEGLDQGKSGASVTIGFSEQDWKTLQLEGTIEKIPPAKDIILSKYPETAKHIDDKTIFLKFTALWWHFTDFKANIHVYST